MSNITLPYSVNRIDGHSSSYSKGTYNFNTTINLYKVQPTYLWFQHADQTADIYVDDVKVTTHWGGYNAFFIDITNYIHVGINNIKVALCNKTRNAIAPSSGDFNFNATLGKVKLFSSPVLPSMDYGYDGFHITSSNISSSSATITIKTNVPAGGTLICKIDDTSTNYHYKEKKPSTGNEISFTTTISNPILWNGKINPHLYTVTLEIYKNGDLYHRYQRKYGFRIYNYVFNETGYLPNNEPYTGFLLNGSPYYLRGVCMHHDIEGKANALSDEDIAHDFEIIQELGCNFIRLAHYPHPKEVYDKCDELGIIVQTEVPCVNRFNSPEISGTNCPQEYYDHLDIQYTDMVRQHFNHPCICFWGLFNEATTNDSTWAGAKLNYYKALIKDIDPERWVGYVTNAASANPSSTFGNPDLDWFGCNIYVGWYSSQNSNNPTSQINSRVNNIINNLHKPLAYSEYGCGGTQHCHSDDFMTTTTRGNHERHDIEYMMWLHEGQIAAIKNFPQLLFTSEWQLFDIAVSSRNEGYTICLDGVNSSIDDNLRYRNNKGLVERDHITKKDTFYLYKAWWNQTDKFVHICGKDYEKYTDRVIKCYTNDGNSLSLYVNNTFIETVNVTNNIAEFTPITFNNSDFIKVIGETTYDTIGTKDYSSEYLTFEILSDGDITWNIALNNSYRKTIYYSKNNGSWTSITSSVSGESIPVIRGDKIRFKGTNSTYAQSYYRNIFYNYFNGTATFNIYGNIMSLIKGDNFITNIRTLEKTRTFYQMFMCGDKLKDVTYLVLSPNILSQNCYLGLFKNCICIKNAPILYNAALDYGCYAEMFYGCTSLINAPELPATTLAEHCYSTMFYGCTNLIKAPELPAKTLVYYCYNEMFKGCSKLNYIKCLATSRSASGCTTSWVNGVAANGTFIKNSSMSSWPTGVSGIPSGWTVQDAS